MLAHSSFPLLEGIGALDNRKFSFNKTNSYLSFSHQSAHASCRYLSSLTLSSRLFSCSHLLIKAIESENEHIHNHIILRQNHFEITVKKIVVIINNQLIKIYNFS